MTRPTTTGRAALEGAARPAVPGAPQAGHIASNGFWHPGHADTCPRTPCAEDRHDTDRRHAQLGVAVFLVAALAVGAWAFYTGARQVGSLVECRQLEVNTDPGDDCPQGVGVR
jgi:hypothetical protein